MLNLMKFCGVTHITKELMDIAHKEIEKKKMQAEENKDHQA